MGADLLRDASLKLTLALPNGAATTTSTAIDTGKTSAGDQTTRDLVLSAPAMATGVMGDAKTMKYDICWSDAADLSGPTTYITSALVQTGAGGAGCAAATFTCRLPSTAGRYVFFKATGSASGNASGSNATLEVLS